MFLLFLISRLPLAWRPLWMAGIALSTVAMPGLAQEMGDLFSSPAIAARSAVLMNPVNGQILFAKEPRLRLPPASTTKILTALVTLERLDLNTRVTVSPQAASAPPSRIGLHAGEAALAQDLLYGLMLKSGNDAAETLAEAAGGSVPGFAELMNTRAWQVGARDSHFTNPHGLPDENHYSTAYDLALIFRQAMAHPLFAEIVRTRSAALRIESGQGLYGDWRMVPVMNHNRLLASYEGAQGGKTGFTLKARRCFVGEVDRGGVRLIVAILNSPDSGTLWQDARTLLDYGFSRYGLAAPPPVKPEPVLMARYTPEASTESRSAVRPAPVEEDEEQEMGIRWVSAQKPPVRQTEQPTVDRPAMQPRLAVATKKPVLEKPVAQPRLAVTTKKPVLEKPVAQPRLAVTTKKPVLEKPVAQPRLAVAAKKPSSEKPSLAVAKTIKPAPAAVAVKAEIKRPVTKVARAEPVVLPKSKNPRRGG